jgi:diaminohydroxyphosphoribosylaminopyrimidine deaminase/5-amino-6-(5-phosphoribosylamino)uracil reductase
MRRCIELALKGQGNVAPNPLVGAVIVHEDRIIGEGYHQTYGEAHAEVNAVNSVKEKHLLRESTIYVSLEPCAHHGKTPPCADLIVKECFKAVVIGCTDSFDQVSGKGAERIRRAGIEVRMNVLEDDCRALNKHFFTFHEKRRPFVFLKWAQSKNGFIDNSESTEKEITWISHPEIQPIVHSWRSQHMGILVGKNTIINDDPSLTVRRVSGNNPVRVVLDSRCALSKDYKVFNSTALTVILNLVKNDEEGNVRYIKLNDMSPSSILQALYNLELQSMMIEGGRNVLQSFIDAELWDEACIIEGQNSIESGTQAPTISKTNKRVEKLFGDQLNFITR